MTRDRAARQPIGSPSAAAGQEPGLSPVSAWLTGLQFDWSGVTHGMRQRQVAKHETLFLEGQSADTVYVVEQGRIRLSAFSYDGKERHLMIIGPNGLVGDCGLFSSDRYLVSAVAAAETTVSTVPMSNMLQAVKQQPQLLHQCHQLSNMRFRVMLRHLALHGSNSARRRVCHHLEDLLGSYGVEHPDGMAISLTFTQHEMGCICGLSRVSVSQIICQLEREQILARDGRLVVIRDAKRLAQMSRA